MVEQWYALLAEAGLRVLEISMYKMSLQNSAIVAVPKQVWWFWVLAVLRSWGTMEC